MSGTDSNVVGIAPSVVETTALDSGIVIAPLEPAGAVSAPGAIGEVSLAKTEDFGEEEAPDQLVQIQYLEQLGKVQWQELMILEQLV